MRDWNFDILNDFLTAFSVCILPMRDWNSTARSIANQVTRTFVSYLWGIETLNNLFQSEETQAVCILPMRDWNWWARQYTSVQVVVCILPMRDWNLQNDWCNPRNIAKFVSYLWGIETCYWVARTFWTNPVCILPMRDWNEGDFCPVDG